MGKKTIKHLNPVWEEKANFIIGARGYDKVSEDSPLWEQLWSKRISDYIFEVCCIPFFVYNIALGDEVRTDPDYWILEVTKPSGHFTFRVWFGDSSEPKIREEVVAKANQLGCLWEWYSTNLLAIDAPSAKSAEQISGFLLQKERLGQLAYETGQN